jgi:hypothetical protein
VIQTEFTQRADLPPVVAQFLVQLGDKCFAVFNRFGVRPESRGKTDTAVAGKFLYALS